MIRLAVAADVPRLVEMGLRFRGSSAYRRYVVENAEQMTSTATMLVERGGMLVSDRDGCVVGMLGYILFPHFLSGETVASEVCWWVEPEYRGEGLKLLRAAETHAKERGAVHMQMIAPSDQVASIYQRCGYQFVEAAYQRTL
jgi:GNAT superfamily N-acetyltransferase